MKILWLVVALVACVLPISAQDNEYLANSGNAFLATCGAGDKSTYSGQELVNLSACTGYVNGFTKGFSSAVEYSGYEPKNAIKPLFCIPDGVKGLQIVRLLLKHIRDNPKDAHLTSGALLVLALQNAYPCK